MLKEWIDRTGRSRYETAAFLGVDQSQIAHYILGDRTPSLAKGVEIEAKTGIPVRAWAESLLPETAETSAGHDANHKVDAE